MEARLKFVSGFGDIIPKFAIAHMGTPAEIATRLYCECNVEIDDLMKFTVFSGEQVDSAQKSMFWDAIQCMNQLQRRQLITFITAFPSVPLGRVSELCRDNKIVVEFITDKCRLPEARTCFFHLVIPVYQSSRTYLQKLIEVISQPSEFRFI